MSTKNATKNKILSPDEQRKAKRLFSVLVALQHVEYKLTVRDLAAKHSISVGTVSTRIKEGNAILDTEHYEIEQVEFLLNELHNKQPEEKKGKEVTPQQLAVRMLYEKATSPHGVKSKDEYTVYSTVFGYTEKGAVNITTQQKTYIRRRVRELATSAGKVALFVPDWINTAKPAQSLHNMNLIAHELYEYMEAKVQELVAMNNVAPEAAYSVKHALVNMVVEGMSHTNLERQIKGYTDVVEGLTANGVATEEDKELDYHKEWNEGLHTLITFEQGEMKYGPTTPEAIHAVFEGLKDLDEQGYIY